MNPKELISEFSTLTNELLEHYQKVEDAVKKLDSQPGSADIEQLTHVNALMDPVKQTESRIAPLREKMQALDLSVPDKTKAVIDRTIAVVGYLLPKIGELESNARVARQKLAPSIGDSVRALKMKSAYGRSR